MAEVRAYPPSLKLAIELVPERLIPLGKLPFLLFRPTTGGGSKGAINSWICLSLPIFFPTGPCCDGSKLLSIFTMNWIQLSMFI